MKSISGAASKMAKAADWNPKNPRSKPAAGNSTPKAATPKKAEMGSGGLKAGISALQRNHKMTSGTAAKYV